LLRNGTDMMDLGRCEHRTCTNKATEVRNVPHVGTKLKPKTVRVSMDSIKLQFCFLNMGLINI